MRKGSTLALSLALSAALCGCASSGKAVRPVSTVCPQTPRPPASLMVEPNYEMQVWQVFFESAPSAMPSSEPGSPTPDP